MAANRTLAAEITAIVTDTWAGPTLGFRTDDKAIAFFQLLCRADPAGFHTTN